LSGREWYKIVPVLSGNEWHRRCFESSKHEDMLRKAILYPNERSKNVVDGEIM
jgi:hypothetical protein